MRKLRKTTDQLLSMSPISRFLNRVCIARGISQADVLKRLDGSSPSTVSRWFRSEASPHEDELPALAAALDVPVPTLRALVELDDRRGTPMQEAARTWSSMLLGSKELVFMAGHSMSKVVPENLSTQLPGRTVVAALMSPRAPKEEFMFAGQDLPEWLYLTAWLYGVGTLRAIATRADRPRVRLWLRERFALFGHDPRPLPLVQLVANDWFSIFAPKPYGGGAYRVAFPDDEVWVNEIGPLIEHMTHGDEPYDGHELVWDSNWGSDRWSPLADIFSEAAERVARPLREDALSM